MAKKQKNYVNNKDFYEAMVEFKKSVNDAEAKGENRPQVPKYIAECITLIAQRLSHKPNFINYTFREDMIGDGIENSLRYIDNFNPEKTQNPFAYFTQIIYYAFLRRIQKEKKYLYTKFKATENANLMGEVVDLQGHDISGQFDVDIKASDGAQEYMADFVESFEAKQNKMKKVEDEDSINN